MPNDKQFIVTNDHITLTGVINFSNVTTIYNESVSQLEKYTVWNFDFSNVKSSNSAALALMVEWLKLAKKSNKSIQFTHLPLDLLSIARASGMEKLLLF